MQKVKIKLTILTFLITQLMFGANIFAQNENNLTVNISGINEIKGKLFVYLYSQSDGFPTDFRKAVNHKEIKVNSKNIKIQFNNIKNGNYAISVYHDINSNNEIDTNLWGIPKEPVGVSNNVESNFGPPDFENAKFNFYGDTIMEIRIE